MIKAMQGCALVINEMRLTGVEIQRGYLGWLPIYKSYNLCRLPWVHENVSRMKISVVEPLTPGRGTNNKPPIRHRFFLAISIRQGCLSSVTDIFSKV